MSTSESRFIARPKVRFSQAPAAGEESARAQDAGEGPRGPRVRSIVNFEKKIRILKMDDAAGKVKEQGAVSRGELINERAAAGSPVVPSQGKIAREDSGPLSDATNSRNISAAGEKDSLKSAQSAVAEGKICTTEVLELKTAMGTNKVRSKRGKENEELTVKRDAKSESTVEKTVVRTKVRRPVVHQRAKGNVLGCHAQGSDLKRLEEKVKPLSACNKSAQARNTKFGNKAKVVSVMPCYKHKVDSKAKSSAVKMSVIRDIIGHEIKPYIGPGVLHRKPEESKKTAAADTVQAKSIPAVQKLSKPEYNSIMCTVNQLKEVQKEKIATDANHLPDTYKNLISGKVSAALDFPLDEAIYKNLIDLTIDDTQLPGRFTRSKDPEPRQRDIAPRLSDFFTPAATNEYCHSVSVNPRTPENVDGCSAFKISDKIIEWKQSMEDEQ